MLTMDVTWKQWSDRLIPVRINSEVAHFNLLHNIGPLSYMKNEDEEEKGNAIEPIFINNAKKANSIIAYREMLLKAIGIHHTKILKQPTIANMLRSTSNEAKSSWPVVPRRRPLITKPEIILDVPDVGSGAFMSYRQATDWGENGEIATVFLGQVHLFSTENGTKRCTKMKHSPFHKCLKFSSAGNQLAVSRHKNKISVLDVKTLKVLYTKECAGPSCAINTIQWTKNGKVVTGCSKGVVMVFQRSVYNKKEMAGYQVQMTPIDQPILDLSISCYEKYVLISQKGYLTICFTRNDYHQPVNQKLPDEIPIMSTAWHPWNESIFAVGYVNNCVIIKNVQTSKIIDMAIIHPYFKGPQDCILDCLVFNRLSAELVVSFYYQIPNTNEDNTGYNIITIFKDLETRVDEVRFHRGRVPHMFWDCSGTKLATLDTVNEDLAVWEFFGKGPKMEKPKTKFAKTSKFSQSVITFPIQFGEVVR